MVVDLLNVEEVSKWEQPKNVFEIRSFLEIVGYYQCFVKDFSTIVSPMTRLPRKGVKFECNARSEESFMKLEELLTTTLLLIISEREKGYTVYCDVLKKGTGCILMQTKRVIVYASQQRFMSKTIPHTIWSWGL